MRKPDIEAAHHATDFDTRTGADAAGVDLAALGLPAALHAGGGASVAEVVLHVMRLDIAASAVDAIAAALDREERKRYDRFVFPEHRRRYACSRYALRQVLARHCAMAPAALRFANGCYGRPFLSTMPGSPDFNLSHSGEWAVIAVSSDCLVGVDVEVPGRTDPDELAGRVLTPDELVDWQALDASLRHSRFLDYWTAKESFMKLNALGLQLEPRSIQVDWTAPGSVHSATVRCDNAEVALAVRRASLARVELGHGVVCAVATPRPARITLVHAALDLPAPLSCVGQ